MLRLWKWGMKMTIQFQLLVEHEISGSIILSLSLSYFREKKYAPIDKKTKEAKCLFGRKSPKHVRCKKYKKNIYLRNAIHSWIRAVFTIQIVMTMRKSISMRNVRIWGVGPRFEIRFMLSNQKSEFRLLMAFQLICLWFMIYILMLKAWFERFDRS